MLAALAERIPVIGVVSRSSTDPKTMLARFAPLATAAAVATGIVLQSVWEINGLTGSKGAPPAAQIAYTSLPQATPSPTINAQKIIDAHLFGNARTDSAQALDALPESRVSLVVAGILAFEDPHEGFAFVGQNASTTKLYRVGDAVSPSIRLSAVYPDRVVLDRGGALENLFLPKQKLVGMAASEIVASAAPPPADRPLPTDPQFLSDMLSIRPITLDGAEHPTYKVFPAAGAKNSMAVFRRAGLRSGDQVTAIDGTALCEPSADKSLLADLGKATSATIDVKRGEQQVHLVVGL